ncbi:methylated-DNA--[protein]-cysteine S-methyltransferase [Leucobacter sp. GX24907]
MENETERPASESSEAETGGVPGARHAWAATSLGDLLLVARSTTDGDALVGLYFANHSYPPAADAIGEAVDLAEDPVLAATAQQLREYLAGERREFDLPLRASGDEFRERVWERLLAIPYGETTTYGALAAELGSRGLAQLVGQAVGHNPISIVIPCHRVVGADGSLTGYAGGKERKQRLLELEEPPEAAASRLF